MQTIKKLSIITAIFSLVLVLISCHRGNTIMINNGDDNLTINYSGEIKFNDDENAIKSISSNGYLRYQRNAKKLNAETDSRGGIKYELSDNGQKLNPDNEEGKLFIENAVKDMINLGFDAKDRLQRIYKKGGAQAVLDEVEKVKMDYVKTMYLEYLFSADSVTQSQMTELAKKIGTEIGSDYDKGRMLMKFPFAYLKDSVTAHAWFEAVKNMGSDNDKANVLIYIAREPVNTEQLNETVDIANSIGSDYDKARVLKELIFKRTFAEENFDRTVDAVSYVNSDYEKANLLKALIEKEKPSPDHFGKLLDVIEHVGSDYDRTNLIKELVETGLPSGVNFDKLLSAIIHTDSDYDKANLIRVITTRNISGDEQWIGIINAIADISSDNDKTNLLIMIAPGMPKNDQVKNTYLRVARTINEGSDLGRAIKAVD